MRVLSRTPMHEWTDVSCGSVRYEMKHNKKICLLPCCYFRFVFILQNCWLYGCAATLQLLSSCSVPVVDDRPFVCNGWIVVGDILLFRLREWIYNKWIGLHTRTHSLSAQLSVKSVEMNSQWTQWCTFTHTQFSHRWKHPLVVWVLSLALLVSNNNTHHCTLRRVHYQLSFFSIAENFHLFCGEYQSIYKRERDRYFLMYKWEYSLTHRNHIPIYMASIWLPYYFMFDILLMVKFPLPIIYVVFGQNQ